MEAARPDSGATRRATAAGHLTDADFETLEAEVASELDDAVAYAEEGHDEPVEDLTRWVYSDRSPT